tara:strand:- start:334 stop:681 length:348 start_codon:yes stop_codon:yes gene_type:complete
VLEATVALVSLVSGYQVFQFLAVEDQEALKALMSTEATAALHLEVVVVVAPLVPLEYSGLALMEQSPVGYEDQTVEGESSMELFALQSTEATVDLMRGVDAEALLVEAFLEASPV